MRRIRLPMTLLRLKGTVRKRETNAAPSIVDPSPSCKVKIKPGFHKLARGLQGPASISLQARSGVPAGAEAGSVGGGGKYKRRKPWRRPGKGDGQ